jgi:hypothetical protein
MQILIDNDVSSRKDGEDMGEEVLLMAENGSS